MTQQKKDETADMSPEKMLLTLGYIDETICAMQHIVKRLRKQLNQQIDQQNQAKTNTDTPVTPSLQRRTLH